MAVKQGQISESTFIKEMCSQPFKTLATVCVDLKPTQIHAWFLKAALALY